MKILDYEEKKRDVINVLENNQYIVLATGDSKRISARQVWFASDDLKILFITSKAYDKYKQIEKNNNVALCLENVQMEGVATIKGHPNLEENSKEKSICLNKNKDVFEKYSKYKNTVLIEIVVQHVKMWNNGGRECLDINKQTAFSIG